VVVLPGHILPALESWTLTAGNFNASGCFVGCGVGLESKLVPSRGVRFKVIPGLPWAREKWFGRLRAAACLPPAILAARRILVAERAEVVIGSGGLCLIQYLHGRIHAGVPVVIHEANVEPGMANRMLEHLPR